MSGETALDPRALLGHLDRHRVRHVLAGSVAAMAYGVELVPRDLDIVPELEPGRYDELLPRAVAIEAFGLHLHVAHVDHLIAQLDRWDRARDRARRAALAEARARFLAGERPPALDAHPGWGELRR